MLSPDHCVNYLLTEQKMFLCSVADHGQLGFLPELGPMNETAAEVAQFWDDMNATRPIAIGRVLTIQAHMHSLSRLHTRTLLHTAVQYDF